MNDVQKSTELRFTLKVRIIADVLEHNQIKLKYFGTDENCQLLGTRLYQSYKNKCTDIVYVGHADKMERDLDELSDVALVLIGSDVSFPADRKAPAILVEDDIDLFELFELIQDTFQLYWKWNWEIEEAINSSHALDNILRASMDVLHNPMFMHDNNFFILSDPCHTEGMSEYEIDPKTGKEMVSIEMINDFRTDKDYLNGLDERGPAIFPSDKLGYHNYQILYRNLWLRDKYVGRVLVDAIRNPIRPGDFYVLDHLGKMLEYYMEQRRLVLFNFDNDIDSFFKNFISSRNIEERQVINYLDNMFWNREDRYVCLRIINEQREFSLVSSSAILGQIDNQIGSGHTFYYDNGIAVIVNLSYNHVTIAEVIKHLAVILRDNLLKIGISSEIRDFILIPEAYKQAQIALEFGRISGSMYWYYYFEQYMLEYIVECARKEMPLAMLCASALEKLKKYDKENNTDLYHTLHVYLNNEENVLQTSKELYIHRSTLFYRLKNIQKIINEDLTDVNVRLKLMMSYFIDYVHHR